MPWRLKYAFYAQPQVYAFYLQALALSKLGLETNAHDMLNDGAAFEAKRSNSWCG